MVKARKAFFSCISSRLIFNLSKVFRKIAVALNSFISIFIVSRTLEVLSMINLYICFYFVMWPLEIILVILVIT